MTKMKACFPRFISYLFLLATLLLVYSCDGQRRAEVKQVKVGDIYLAYYTRGSGDPLIMIMGFRGTMAIWDPALLELLEKHYTLILFDNRGVGLSTDSVTDLTTITQMSEDTAGLIKALGYSKVNVLGWSMGSRIGIELAINHPEIVEKLILCSPNPGGDHQVARKSSTYQELTSKDLTRKEALALIFPDTEEGISAADAFVNRLRKAVVMGFVPEDLEISTQTIERQVNALKLWDEDNQIYDKLANIKIPTLVTAGLVDSLDPPGNAQLVASRIPYAWSAFFAGAGHDFHSQDYKNFAELVVLFINSTRKE